MRFLTLDEAPTADRTYTPEQLSPKMSRTPEGFLLCEDVPIARTGEMLYGPGEVPIEPGPGGFIIIDREPAEVFRVEFVRSFEGKSVVVYHPGELVNAQNVRRFEVGHIINPRQGGEDAPNFLIADLLIKAQDAIDLILTRRLREVSAGYTAEYEQTGPGRGRQYNMLANHVALVESARCGPRCAIGDHKTCQTGDPMHITKDNASAVADARKNFMDGIGGMVRKALNAIGVTDKALQDKAVQQVADEAGPFASAVLSARDEEAHKQIGELKGRLDQYDNAMRGYDTRFKGWDESIEALRKHTKFGDAAEGEESEEEKAAKAAAAAKDAAVKTELEAEAPTGAADKARVATDSQYMADSFQEAVSGAEILVPGIALPTFDQKAKPTDTLLAVCKLRQTALQTYHATTDGKAMIDAMSGGKAIDWTKISCGDVRSLFRATVTAKKAAKAAMDAERQRKAPDQDKNKTAGPIRSIAELNAFNAKYYGAHKAN